MSKDKIESLSRKDAFIKKYPSYNDWPYWYEDGYPALDPAVAATFIPAPEIDADLNSPDEDDDEVCLKKK